MAWTTLDYTVWVDSSDNVQYIQRSDGASIPPDIGNTDYQAFLGIDGANKACTRKSILTSTAPLITQEERLTALESAVLSLIGV